MTPIGCREAVQRLWDYLDAGLPSTSHREVEEHLDRCRRCCGELEFARHLRALLARPRADAVPADVRARLEGLIEDLPEVTGADG